MATNFPASLDTLTNPTSSDSLSSPSHSAQHANVNDAVEALQAKVGADSSAVTSSLDYKVAQLESDVSGLVTGKILQVVSATTATATSTSSTSHVDTALSATITPTSATSTVVIMVSVSALENLNNSNISYLRLYRGDTATGTGLGTADHAMTYSVANVRNDMNAAIVFVDSPATTSATTYTLGLRTNNFSAAKVDGQQSMVLMEVSA
jgi:hypothetical protein